MCYINAFSLKQFQQTKAKDFCIKLGLYSRELDDKDEQTRNHLLVNKKKSTLYCFTPKVGCTNLKRLFFMTQGNINYTINVIIMVIIDDHVYEISMTFYTIMLCIRCSTKRSNQFK